MHSDGAIPVPQVLQERMCLVPGIASDPFCDKDTLGKKKTISGRPTDPESYSESDRDFCTLYASYRQRFQVCSAATPHNSGQVCSLDGEADVEHAAQTEASWECIPLPLVADIEQLDYVCAGSPDDTDEWTTPQIVAAVVGGVGAAVGVAGFALRIHERRESQRARAATPHQDVILAQLVGFTESRNRAVQQSAERFLKLNALQRNYIVFEAIEYWNVMSERDRQKYIRAESSLTEGKLPTPFLKDFLLGFLGDPRLVPLVEASARVWAERRGIPVPLGASAVVEEGRAPTPPPLTASRPEQAITPDPSVARRQLEGLVQSHSRTLLDAGRRFQRLSETARRYLSELLIHHWYVTFSEQDRERSVTAEVRGRDALLPEAIPKSVVKWFAEQYLMNEGEMRAIEEQARHWEAARIPRTRHSRTSVASVEEFHPRLDPVRLQLVRLRTIGRLSYDVQTYLARIALERWSSLTAGERAAYVDISDEPARETLPRRFVELAARHWRTLEPFVLERAIIHARLLEQFPEWNGIRFAVTQTRTLDIWNALHTIPRISRRWLLDPRNAAAVRALIRPFGHIGTGMRPALDPAPALWRVSDGPPRHVDFRGYILADVMEQLAHEMPLLRRYPGILERRAQKMIDDYMILSDSLKAIFSHRTRRGKKGTSAIPDAYVAFWNRASSRVATTSRIGNPHDSQETSPVARIRRSSQSEAGWTTVGVLTAADLAVETPTLRHIGRATTRVGLGAIPFGVAAFVSDTVWGKPHPTFREFVTNYGSLAAGGGAGHTTMESIFRKIDGRPFFDQSALARELSQRGLRGLANRSVGFVTALMFHDWVTTGRVALESLPKRLSQYALASTLVRNFGGRALELRITKTATRALHLAKTVSALSAPETLGASLAGAALAMTADFLVLGAIESAEAWWVERKSEAELRDNLSEAVRACNELMARRSRGADVSMTDIAMAESSLEEARLLYEACFLVKIKRLANERDHKLAVLRKEEEEWMLDRRGVTMGTIRDRMEEKRRKTMHDYGRSIASIEQGDERQIFYELPFTHQPGTLSSWDHVRIWFTPEDRLKTDEQMRRMALRAHEREGITERIATNLVDVEDQLNSYITRYNEFWKAEIENELIAFSLESSSSS